MVDDAAIAPMLAMNQYPKSRIARTTMIALASIVVATACAEDLPKGFQVNGHIDLFYQYDFNKPPTGSSINLRNFDVQNNEFSLAVLQVNVTRAPTKDQPFGLTLNFTTGKNADLENSSEPAGQNTYKLLQQAYVSYLLPSGITVDFGKYLSPMGYESVVSADNDNYSRSFLYTLAEPLYHTGIRATIPVNKVWTATAYVYNGWNEVEDANAAKSVGLSFAGTVGKTAVTATYCGGNEGSDRVNGIGFSGTSHVDLGDVVLSQQLTSKLKVALGGDYASAKGIDTGDPTGKWYGLAAYAAYAATDKVTAGLRYESVSDPNGLRTTKNAEFHSLTGTLAYKANKDASFYLEVRHDTSNRSIFNSKDGGFDSKRTTLSFGHVLRF